MITWVNTFLSGLPDLCWSSKPLTEFWSNFSFGKRFSTTNSVTSLILESVISYASEVFYSFVQFCIVF